jgi:hypothetical protein
MSESYVKGDFLQGIWFFSNLIAAVFDLSVDPGDKENDFRDLMKLRL